jgi:hypothetical protein
VVFAFCHVGLFLATSTKTLNPFRLDASLGPLNASSSLVAIKQNRNCQNIQCEPGGPETESGSDSLKCSHLDQDAPLIDIGCNY